MSFNSTKLYLSQILTIKENAQKSGENSLFNIKY